MSRGSGVETPDRVDVGDGRPATRGEIWRGVSALVLLAVVVLVPLGWLVWMSLGHYGAVLGSAPWWHAIASTLVVTAGVVTVQLVLGLVFGVALWHLSGIWRPVRFLALVPAALGLVVGAQAGRAAVEGGFVATWFDLDPGGATTALAGVVLGELWRTTGLVVVLVHAGLSRVPTTLLDAAVADGASAWQRWWRVVWPAVTPALVALVAFRLLDSWRLLDGPWLVRAPGSFRTTGSAVVADTAFESLAEGPAAAAAVVLVVLGLLLVGTVLGLARVVRAR